MSPINKAYYMSHTKKELIEYIERLINDLNRLAEDEA